ncbi:GAP family protein [Mycobacterium sp. 21AC1]|uniref:GAP family protein n=1 Tax=[Mycobacterium] appelbergii TaxID=2939269 RepID=UPI002938E40B|nr:GAP family protein [Mycobacterium sp. 21AC1]MDV3126105.1 GAP family protein [Mycobacterium sp. 21AC1]
MWSEVLGLAFLVSLNPMLLGFTLLVISRPRPVQNLLVFWVGALVVNVPSFVGALMVMHWVPSFTSFAQDLATPDEGSSIKPFQLGTGVFALVIAVLMAVRLWVRQRAPEPAPVGARGDSSLLVEDPKPQVDDSPPSWTRNAMAKIRSIFGRLLRRAHEEWDNGALWVALVFGMAYMPPPPLVLLVDTLIVGSGLAIGTQIIASIAFVFAMLAVFEIVLFSYVVAPAKTQAVLRPVHDWSLAHRAHILLVLFAVVGLWELLIGFGIM